MQKWDEIFEQWINSVQHYSKTGGPARGTIAGAMLVTENLRDEVHLNISDHRVGGHGQYMAVGRFPAILARYGETRPYAVEVGRTNRGSFGEVDRLLTLMKDAGFQSLEPDQRDIILTRYQELLVQKVRDFHDLKRLEFVYDQSKSTRQIIGEILEVARKRSKDGEVAQYLVGAKLQLRFPSLEISNDRFSAADQQTGRHGDFQIGDTAFHVTVTPTHGHYLKCVANINQGLRVYLIVPERRLAGARDSIETYAPGQIAVESIESFVANNIEEIAGFSKGQLLPGFAKLLNLYNQRVESVEIDRSLLIDIPANLECTDP